MRCNNCGYDNEPGVSACIKCGHPLQMGGQPQSPYQSNPYQQQQGMGEQLKATVVGSAYANEPQPRATVVGAAYANEPQPRPTVVGPAYANEPQPRPTVVMGPGGPQPAGALQGDRNVEGGTRRCPKCGYPVAANSVVCPGCGAQLDNAVPAAQTKKSSVNEEEEEFDVKTTCDECGKEVSANLSTCPYCNAPIRQKTVFVRRHRIRPKTKCTLTTILDEDERQEVRTNNYEGEKVMLTRDNTEPDNFSITSKEQAELVFEDGKWYIENHSELCTTYVEANRKIEIQPGDVIMLGDRRFKFTVE